MKQIYKGKISKVYIRNLEVRKDSVNVITATSILKKDALFYKNFLGKMISIDYDCPLPTLEEATHYVESNGKKLQRLNTITCIYSEEEECTPMNIPVEQAKKLIKESKKKNN